MHPHQRNILPVVLASHGPTCRHSQTACELPQIPVSEGQLSSKPPVHTKVVPFTPQDMTMIYSKSTGTIDEVEPYEYFKNVVWYIKYQTRGHAQNEQLDKYHPMTDWLEQVETHLETCPSTTSFKCSQLKQSYA